MAGVVVFLIALGLVVSLLIILWPEIEELKEDEDKWI